MPELGDVVAKHTKANAEGVKLERPDSREISLSRFESLGGVGDLLDRLFGSTDALSNLLTRLEKERGPVDPDEVAYYRRVLRLKIIAQQVRVKAVALGLDRYDDSNRTIQAHAVTWDPEKKAVQVAGPPPDPNPPSGQRAGVLNYVWVNEGDY